MPKIDTSSWGEFRLGDLFSVKKSKSVDKTYLSFDTNGKYDFIGRTSINNGVQGKLNQLHFEPNEAETYSVTQIGDNVCQYRENKWYSSQNIFILTPVNKKMNLANKFITTLITTTLKTIYGEDAYSSYPTLKTLPQMILKLPIDANGEPDWLYMENYMRNIEVRVSTSISKLESAQGVENSKIDISSWGKFELRKLFGACRRGSRLVQAERIDGEVPLVTAGYENVGITSNIGNTNMEVFKDCISIDMFGNCFYRDYKFNADDNVLIFAENIKNKYVSMYIAGVVGKAASGYDYTNQYRINNYNRQEIKLPTTSSGDPDWLYMENYMKALETRVNDFLDKTTSTK